MTKWFVVRDPKCTEMLLNMDRAQIVTKGPQGTIKVIFEGNVSVEFSGGESDKAGWEELKRFLGIEWKGKWSEAERREYFYEYPMGDGRKIRGLSLKGFNLVRSMVGLPEVAPSEWLRMTPEEKKVFRRETLERATPELAHTLFGPDADLESYPINE